MHKDGSFFGKCFCNFLLSNIFLLDSPLSHGSSTSAYFGVQYCSIFEEANMPPLSISDTDPCFFATCVLGVIPV